MEHLICKIPRGGGVGSRDHARTLESWPLPCWAAFLVAGDDSSLNIVEIYTSPFNLHEEQWSQLFLKMYNEFSKAQEIL